MSKSIVVFETPCDCGKCMFLGEAEMIHIGDFQYKRLYRCRLEPEGLDEDEGDIVYLNDFIFTGKPPWCPLKKLPERALVNTDVSSIKDLRDKSLLAIGWNACLDEIGG